MKFQRTKLFLYIVLFVTATLSLSACSTYRGIKLSRLSINSKARNGLVIDRYPDYGDGHPNGCIIMAEMNVSLNMNRKRTSISGFLTDVYNTDTLRNVTVLLEEASGNKSTLTTDDNGRFSHTSAAKIESIFITAVAYRNFMAKF